MDKRRLARFERQARRQRASLVHCSFGGWGKRCLRYCTATKKGGGWGSGSGFWNFWHSRLMGVYHLALSTTAASAAYGCGTSGRTTGGEGEVCSIWSTAARLRARDTCRKLQAPKNDWNGIGCVCGRRAC